MFSALFERSRNSRIVGSVIAAAFDACSGLEQAGRVSMTTSVVKELYNSPNGDRWALCRDQSGKLVVSHQPNHASGGRASEIGVEAFLSQHRSGPEHQALKPSHILMLDRATVKQRNILKTKYPERWETLLPGVGKTCRRRFQENLFDAAVALEGETIRQQLAIYLHGKREHTVDTAQPRAIPEPDSLGG